MFDEVATSATSPTTDIPNELDQWGNVRNIPSGQRTGTPDVARVHSDSRCVFIHTVAATAGEAAAHVVQTLTGSRPWSVRRCKVRTMGEDERDELAQLIDDYLWELDPREPLVVTIGNYTPRGRKRRDAPKQRRVLSVQLGGEWYCLPGVVYRGRELRITQRRITARCYCRVQGITGRRTFTVWEADS